MVISIAGRKMYLWRAVDGEGEVLEILVQSQRDQAAASRLLRKLLRRQGFVPTAIAPTNSDPMARRFAKLAFHDCMSKDYAPTIEPRTRISRFADANERRKASNRRGRLSASLPPTRSFTMFS